MADSRGLRSMRRVHIAPLGYERDRIFVPATRYNADSLYLLGPTTPSSSTPTYHADLLADLDDAGIAVERVDVDLNDIYDVLGQTTTLAARHGGDEVLVNVSSGPTLAGVGAAIACMSTHATAYSVEPESYAHDVQNEPLTEGVASVSELPNYPIESPTRDQIAVMDYIHSRSERGYTVRKRDLIEFAEESDLSFMTDPPTESRQSKYRRLSSAVIDPLTEKQYLHVRTAGRRKLVTLTDTGRSVYVAFAHKLQFE
ncbi:hypothetical protein SAMN04487950_0293 [Halogranum rubrum]|uniref:Uncharacterized protein n=1 Tax=Halogranum rubrum TaxID=553466 RepID=A0A1I4B455_9EURY|nr:DUF6293 family protein [Halogranum rubrum]SFK63484.1 hypothetical protein SAMN04487950_0293 [Halogranum rubrum]